MHDDLVKRLRRMLDWELCDYDHNFKFADETIAEAADAIEELSKRIARAVELYNRGVEKSAMWEALEGISPEPPEEE